MIGYVGLILMGVYLVFIGVRGILVKPVPEKETFKYPGYDILQYTDGEGIPTISIKSKKP